MRKGLLTSLSGEVIVLIFLISIAGASHNAAAKQLAGIVTIEEDGNYGWRLDVAMPSQLEFNITVLNGTSVDVLILDQENYTKYTEKSDFGFYEEYSVLGTSNASMNITVLAGTVYVIVDNTDRPQVAGAANSSQPAEVQYWIASSFDLSLIPDQGTPWIAYLMIGILAPSLVAVVILTRKAFKERKSSLGKTE